MSVEKEKNLDFIKAFQSITIKSICDDLEIGRGNLYSGKLSNENLEKIKNEIVKRFSKIFYEVQK